MFPPRKARPRRLGTAAREDRSRSRDRAEHADDAPNDAAAALDPQSVVPDDDSDRWSDDESDWWSAASSDDPQWPSPPLDWPLGTSEWHDLIRYTRLCKSPLVVNGQTYCKLMDQVHIWYERLPFDWATKRRFVEGYGGELACAAAHASSPP